MFTTTSLRRLGIKKPSLYCISLQRSAQYHSVQAGPCLHFTEVAAFPPGAFAGLRADKVCMFSTASSCLSQERERMELAMHAAGETAFAHSVALSLASPQSSHMSWDCSAACCSSSRRGMRASTLGDTHVAFPVESTHAPRSSSPGLPHTRRAHVSGCEAPEILPGFDNEKRFHHTRRPFVRPARLPLHTFPCPLTPPPEPHPTKEPQHTTTDHASARGSRCGTPLCALAIPAAAIDGLDGSRRRRSAVGRIHPARRLDEPAVEHSDQPDVSSLADTLGRRRWPLLRLCLHPPPCARPRSWHARHHARACKGCESLSCRRGAAMVTDEVVEW